MRLIVAFDFVEFVTIDGGSRRATIGLTDEVRISEIGKLNGLTRKEGNIKKRNAQCGIIRLEKS